MHEVLLGSIGTQRDYDYQMFRVYYYLLFGLDVKCTNAGYPSLLVWPSIDCRHILPVFGTPPLSAGVLHVFKGLAECHVSSGSVSSTSGSWHKCCVMAYQVL